MAFTIRSYNLGILANAMSAGYRWIWCGDSFSSHNSARVSVASLLAWPMGGIGAWVNPYINGSGFSGIFNSGTQQAGHPYTGSTDDNVQNGRKWKSGSLLNYSSSSTNNAAGDEWRGIPWGNASEWLWDAGGNYDPAGGGANRISRLTLLLPSTMASNANPRPFTTGSTVTMRPIYYAHGTQTEMVDSYQFTDGGGLAGDVALTAALKTDAREMFYRGGTHGATTPVAGTFNSTVSKGTIDTALSTTPDIGHLRTDPGGAQDWFLALAGYVVEVAGNESLAYWQSFADSSWSMEAWATSAAATQATPKRFTDAQWTDALDITTISRTKRPVFVYYLAAEDHPQATIEGYVQDWIDRCRTACADIGLPSPKFLLVGPHNHYLTGAPNTAAMETTQAAYLSVAMLNAADTAFISLYAIMDGTLCDNSISPNPGIAWLASRGLSVFSTGSTSRDVSDGILLDGSNLHPADTDAACLFAKLIGDEIMALSVGVHRHTRIQRQARTLR